MPADATGGIEPRDGVEGRDGGTCVACGGPLRREHEPWASRCTVCGTYRSTLGDRPVTRPLDEDLRCSGLARIRIDNFERVLDALAAVRPLDGARVLDVGAAHGWFVDAALRRGATARGIEPDPVVAAIATRRGSPVDLGWFPDDLPSDARYDVIAFHDVFEHLPDPEAVLEHCVARLLPGGCVVLNLPDVAGLGFRLSRALRRVGVRGPYERLWQVGFPSPHLWYFSRPGLHALLARHGLRVVVDDWLPSLTRRGLWRRVHFDRRPSPASAVQWLLLWLLAPAFNRAATADAMLLVAVRDADAH